MLIIKVKNSSISAPIVRKGRFLTNKKEKEKHGWGIESVKELLKNTMEKLIFNMALHILKLL